MLFRVLCILTGLLLFAPGASAAEGKGKPQVYVILWFDTEDYPLPASDDAALKIADFLTGQGIRATFKVVGEKARTLEKRKRTDVIAALKKHEIGYHSNYHSTQPSPAMYLSSLGWDEGVAEFDRRENPGRLDVQRIFGQTPSCYGQPGSSWGPQSYGAMKKWGMNVYLDAGQHVDLDGKPCYYAGVFNLYKLTHTIRADLKKPEELEKSKLRFAEARKSLLSEGGGVVSIVYHPCEWVHKQFWDGVNFAKGANPPRSAWKAPPQKTADETKQAYRIFSDYIAFIKRFADVQFITASEAAKLYADRARKQAFSPAALEKVARKATEVTFQTHGDTTLSASEVFELLNRYVSARAAKQKVKTVVLGDTPLGPTGKVPLLEETVTTSDSQFLRTSKDVDDYLRKHGRIPTTVWLGSTPVPPEAYLPALAKVALELLANKPVPTKIEVKATKLEAAKYVSEDDPKLWTWVIFPPGFKAPAMMDLAKRQSWSLKPAVLMGRK
jgi:hypothetical protein